MEKIISWWQNLPLGFDGVFFSLGSFEIQYYGLMYLVGFLVCYAGLNWKIKQDNYVFIKKKQLEDLLFGLMASVIVGGRLGYVLLYNFGYYLKNPIEIIWPFRNGEFVGLSGMSFHGGLILCVLYGLHFVRKNKLDFWKTSDLIISVAPLGYLMGRIGNFLNNELYGRVTDSWIGQHFLDFPTQLRHPSQLYQGLLEGLGLVVFLYFVEKKEPESGVMFGLGILWFGAMRFVTEFFREPDQHIGLFLGLSRGQFLSLSLAIAGLILILCRLKPRLDK